MYAFVLQDWVTISGVGTGSIIQTEPDWLDLSPFQDVVAWVDIRDATAGVYLYLETSPTRDENLFMSMSATGYQLSLYVSPTPLVAQFLLGQATVPLATLLRWRLGGTSGTWSTTFRILLSCNSPGFDLQSAPLSPGSAGLMTAAATLQATKDWGG